MEETIRRAKWDLSWRKNSTCVQVYPYTIPYIISLSVLIYLLYKVFAPPWNKFIECMKKVGAYWLRGNLPPSDSDSDGVLWLFFRYWIQNCRKGGWRLSPSPSTQLQSFLDSNGVVDGIIIRKNSCLLDGGIHSAVPFTGPVTCTLISINREPSSWTRKQRKAKQISS